MSLNEFRKAKDAWFRQIDSPLTDALRASFAGLKYFPENSALRFSLPLDRNIPHEPVTMQTSTGELRQYLPAGKVVFSVQGTEVALTVYQDANGYFLPFRDGTCEKESYGAGRYLEPEAEGDMLTVDFNLAYNPYCAYNEHYSCPIPPKENWTTVRLEAGEQRFHS